MRSASFMVSGSISTDLPACNPGVVLQPVSYTHLTLPTIYSV